MQTFVHQFPTVTPVLPTTNKLRKYIWYENRGGSTQRANSFSMTLRGEMQGIFLANEQN